MLSRGGGNRGNEAARPAARPVPSDTPAQEKEARCYSPLTDRARCAHCGFIAVWVIASPKRESIFRSPTPRPSAGGPRGSYRSTFSPCRAPRRRSAPCTLCPPRPSADPRHRFSGRASSARSPRGRSSTSRTASSSRARNSSFCAWPPTSHPRRTRCWHTSSRARTRATRRTPPRNGRVWRPSRHEHRAHQVLSRPLRKEKRIGPLCAQSGKRA